jgi:hypothetical protein
MDDQDSERFDGRADRAAVHGRSDESGRTTATSPIRGDCRKPLSGAALPTLRRGRNVTTRTVRGSEALDHPEQRVAYAARLP